MATFHKKEEEQIKSLSAGLDLDKFGPSTIQASKTHGLQNPQRSNLFSSQRMSWTNGQTIFMGSKVFKKS